MSNNFSTVFYRYLLVIFYLHTHNVYIMRYSGHYILIEPDRNEREKDQQSGGLPFNAKLHRVTFAQFMMMFENNYNFTETASKSVQTETISTTDKEETNFCARCKLKMGKKEDINTTTKYHFSSNTKVLTENTKNGGLKNGVGGGNEFDLTDWNNVKSGLSKIMGCQKLSELLKRNLTKDSNRKEADTTDVESLNRKSPEKEEVVQDSGIDSTHTAEEENPEDPDEFILQPPGDDEGLQVDGDREGSSVGQVNGTATPPKSFSDLQCQPTVSFFSSSRRGSTRERRGSRGSSRRSSRDQIDPRERIHSRSISRRRDSRERNDSWDGREIRDKRLRRHSRSKSSDRTSVNSAERRKRSPESPGRNRRRSPLDFKRHKTSQHVYHRGGVGRGRGGKVPHKTQPHCHYFNLKGCHKSRDVCVFLHKCSRCNSTQHGRADCIFEKNVGKR